MKEIFVVTHPEATHHVEGLVGGWFDSELTELGHTQARSIAASLATRTRPAIGLYSSDLRRCTQTARTIGEALHTEPVLMNQLREKSYGIAGGKPDAWFRRRFIPPPRVGERLDHDEQIEGSETKLEWARRIYAGVDQILANAEEQSIIVTHGGASTFVIARWIGMPLDSLSHVSFKVDPGSITHLVEDDYFHNRSVAVLNDTRHLHR